MKMENLLTRAQVGEILNVSVRTVDSLVQRGELNSLRVCSKTRRFTQRAVDDFIRRAGDIRTRQEQENAGSPQQ